MKFTINAHTSDMLELTIGDVFRLLAGKRLKRDGLEVFVPALRAVKYRLRHFWHGCEQFNRRWPHWVKSWNGFNEDLPVGPKCSICEGRCTWMFGYKNKAPDLNAQKAQDRPPTTTEAYWAVFDGYGMPDGVPENIQREIFDGIDGLRRKNKVGR